MMYDVTMSVGVFLNRRYVSTAPRSADEYVVRGRDMYSYTENDENDVKTWHPLDVVRKVCTVETQTHYSDTCTCTCRVYMVQELGEPYLLQYLGGMYLRKEGM